MNGASIWRYRILRTLGRLVTRTCAALTLGHMPPFVSTSALVVEGSQILVVIDPIRREPILPGGHLAWDESPEAAAMREVREETGIEIEIEALLGVLSGEVLAGERGIVRVVYRGKVTGGSLQSSAEGAACWMEIDDVTAAAGRDAPIVRRWTT